jgi:type VI protein secretion system component VasK
MDWWGRFWGAKKWSLAGLALPLSGDQLWIMVGAVVLLGIALILAVCFLACRMKDDDIETPILSVRRGSKQKRSEEEEKAEERTEDDAKVR